MKEFSMKKRFYLIVGVIFYSVLSMFLLCIGVECIREYISFPKVFVYSNGVLFLLCSPLLMMPIVFLETHPILKGVKAPDSYACNIFKKIFYVVLVLMIISFFIKIKINNELKNKGCVICRGIPSGWMPGTATKYALNEELCKSR